MKFFLGSVVLFFLLCNPLFTADRADQLLLDSAAGMLQKGEYDSAYEEYARILLRFPGSDLVPAARYGMGVASTYSEHLDEAVVEFQKLINQFPDSPFSQLSRQMNTIYYRLYLAPLSGVNVYSLDNAFRASVLDMDEPAGLGIDSKQNLYLSDKDKKLFYTFDSQGKLINTVPMTVPYSVVVAGGDQVWVANNTGVVSPGNPSVTFAGPDGKLLEEVRSVAVDNTGNFYVLSQKSAGIFVYDKNRVLIPGLSFSRTEQFAKVMVNGRSQIFALDKDRKRIAIYDRDGKLFGSIQSDGKELVIQKIQDFAIDPSNHIYVLTDNPSGILIFTPSAQLKKWLPASSKGPLIIGDPRLITVSGDGSIYVVDKSTKSIVRVG